MRIMDEQNWASVRRMVSVWVDLGLGAWVGGRGGLELGRRAGSVAVCVDGIGQGSGPGRVELRGGLAALRG